MFNLHLRILIAKNLTTLMYITRIYALDNLQKLKNQMSSRRYSLMNVAGEVKLACYVNGEWIIDATCTSINEMLESGIVAEDSIRGWVSQQYFMTH